MNLINDQRLKVGCVNLIGVALLFLFTPINVFPKEVIDVCEKGSWKNVVSESYSQEEEERIDDFSKKICKKKKNKGYSNESALKNLLYPKMAHILYCDNGELKEKRKSTLDSHFSNAYTLFCQRRESGQGNEVNNYYAIWPDAFCFKTRSVQSDNFLHLYLKKQSPNQTEKDRLTAVKLMSQTPSLIKFREQVSILCDKLEREEIEYDKAEYLFQQELQYFMSIVGKEFKENVEEYVDDEMDKMDEQIVSWGGYVAGFLGFIATIIGIIVGVKKLSNKSE